MTMNVIVVTFFEFPVTQLHLLHTRQRPSPEVDHLASCGGVSQSEVRGRRARSSLVLRSVTRAPCPGRSPPA